MKKTLRFLGYSLLVVFLVFNLLMLVQAYKTSRFQDYPTTGVPEKQSLPSFLFTGLNLYKKKVDTLPSVPFKQVNIHNNLGQKLEGWYIPAKEAKATVILFHGHGSNKSKILPETEYFHSLGYNTFSIDFRAHGNSEGEKCTIGYEETDDVKAAYDYVRQTGEKRIIVWGVSMGAASLLKAIPEFNLRPEKVILECPFASMEDAVEGFLRKMKIPTPVVSQELMFWGSAVNGMWSYNYKPSEYATAIVSPVLLNWGALDQRVLRYETNEIFRNLGSADKRMVVFSKSGHQSYCRKETQKWKATVADFLSN